MTRTVCGSLFFFTEKKLLLFVSSSNGVRHIAIIFRSHIPNGKTVAETYSLWRHGKVLPEKLATCMIHKPCHNAADQSSSDTESDARSGSDLDSEEDSEDD
jgi:hypothetical protein